MKFPNIEIRKTIALLFAIALILFTAAGMYFKVETPEPFKTVVIAVIAFYFGKSTALDRPQ
jgi:hypothetical protein